tara:strand:- start:200 stop:949 length:750 start_codon:yes stop_codon:yes gene_type:complete
VRNINKLSSGYEVIEFEELDSTMTMMKEMALAGCNIKTAVRAKRQISGRGRHGRVWESPLGNLYFSFLRQSEKNNKNLFAPVFIAALSVAHTIIYVTKNKLVPSIKWPNDILINKSKIAGILIENITIPDKADVLNIGIGINIISNPKEVIYPATNLKKENITISPNEMLNAFFIQFVKINKIFENNGIEMIFEMWNELGHKIGDPVSVKVGSKEIIGKFNGLTKEGALIIIDKLGKKETILAGDVFAI